MRAFLSLVSLCLILATGTAWAGLVGTTNAGIFQDTVDWCQFGCAGSSIATPAAWVSLAGATGWVGLVDTGEAFWNLQQGAGWNGNFPSGMGLIYNGVVWGNTPTSIAVVFDQPNYGAGAYIQANWLGSFTATVSLYDSDYLLLGSYSADGTSDHNAGTALFIGMLDTSPEVYAVEFVVSGAGHQPDFAVGTLGIENGAVPEPASFLLVGPALLALGMLKRRLSH